MDQLNEYKSLCDNLIAEIDFALKYLKEVEEKYSTSSRKTGELHSACEGLLHEEVSRILVYICMLTYPQKQLRFTADDLREKLKYFNELESLSKKFNSPSLSVQDEHFLPLLRKLDECIDFIQKNVSEAILIHWLQTDTGLSAWLQRVRGVSAQIQTASGPWFDVSAQLCYQHVQRHCQSRAHAIKGKIF